MTKEELEKLKNFKVYVFEWDVYVKAEDYKEIAIENKELKERINTMQEFIDYSGWVVQNAIWMLYEEWWEDKALDYLENCYVIWDDGLYEEMEKIYKDED